MRWAKAEKASAAKLSGNRVHKVKAIRSSSGEWKCCSRDTDLFPRLKDVVSSDEYDLTAEESIGRNTNCS